MKTNVIILIFCLIAGLTFAQNKAVIEFEKETHDFGKFKEELNKQRGDWNSCVSIGKQTSRRESYRFLPQM